MKPVRRIVEIRYGMAYYHGKCLGATIFGLGNMFNLPSAGKFKVVIEEKIEGVYKITPWGNHFYCVQMISGSPYSCICRKAFQELFRFKPDGRKRYDIQIKKL